MISTAVCAGVLVLFTAVGAQPATAAATVPTGPQQIRTRTVYGAWEQGEGGSYSIDAAGSVDLDTGQAYASARGEFPASRFGPDRYYLALGSGNAVHVVVPDSLQWGLLRAHLTISSCFDEEGQDVEPCPVGETVNVRMRVDADTPLTTIHNEGGPGYSQDVTGRLGSATGTIGKGRLDASEYAEIVESVVTLPPAPLARPAARPAK